MKSVTLCGSTRFLPEMRAFARKLEALGVVVYEPHPYGKDEWKKLPRDDKKFVALGLTHDHFYKIQMGDVIFIFNKDRYAGNSTTLEIGYAVALGKPIYALSEDSAELCRHVLFREVISSPQELVKRLQ